ECRACHYYTQIRKNCKRIDMQLSQDHIRASVRSKTEQLDELILFRNDYMK
ncbi:hypothetical protein L9F63_002645, partial [Diploptera punctata]